MLGDFLSNRWRERQSLALAIFRRSAPNQRICPSVSGTAKPLAVPMRGNTSARGTPSFSSTQAQMSAERPMPARQCTATLRPCWRRKAKLEANASLSRREAGTWRSRMGKGRNSMPWATHRLSSSSKPSSRISPLSSRQTSVSIPASRQAATSPASHSPPRGRGIKARRRTPSPPIQNISGCIRGARCHGVEIKNVQDSPLGWAGKGPCRIPSSSCAAYRRRGKSESLRLAETWLSLFRRFGIPVSG